MGDSVKFRSLVSNKFGYGNDELFGENQPRPCTNVIGNNMVQNSIIVRQRHERFIKKVCESSVVWGLDNDEGFATSSSNEYEDDDEEPVGLICFWSELALAGSCIKGDWGDYKPVEVSLNDFIENWCVGMSNDNLMVGTNFDQNMFGYESDPLELIIELSAE